MVNARFQRRAALPRTLLAVLGLLIAALSSCSSGTPETKELVDQFHALYNAGQYSKIYYDLVERDPGSTFEMARRCLQDVYDGFGEVQDSKLVDSYRFELFSDDTHLKMTYRTTFARGTGNEEFTFHIVNGHATLVKWYCATRPPSSR